MKWRSELHCCNFCPQNKREKPLEPDKSAKSNIPYTVKEAETPLKMKGAFGSSSATTKEIVTVSTLRLQTSEGPVEFRNIRLYLHEIADEMILGLPFTDVFGFNMSTHLAKNHESLNVLISLCTMKSKQYTSI